MNVNEKNQGLISARALSRSRARISDVDLTAPSVAVHRCCVHASLPPSRGTEWARIVVGLTVRQRAVLLLFVVVGAAAVERIVPASTSDELVVATTYEEEPSTSRPSELCSDEALLKT